MLKKLRWYMIYHYEYGTDCVNAMGVCKTMESIIGAESSVRCIESSEVLEMNKDLVWRVCMSPVLQYFNMKGTFLETAPLVENLLTIVKRSRPVLCICCT